MQTSNRIKRLRSVNQEKQIEHKSLLALRTQPKVQANQSAISVIT